MPGRCLPVFTAGLLLAISLASAAHAQPFCAGIFRAGSGANCAWVGQEWPGFLEQWQAFEKRGQPSWGSAPRAQSGSMPSWRIIFRMWPISMGGFSRFPCFPRGSAG
jgi:hypothetical protein